MRTLSIVLASVLCVVGSARAQTSERPVRIDYEQGILSVTVHCASFSTVLKEISAATDIKITGSPVDNCIYGTFGPGTPAAVFTDLLNGTHVNFMYVEHKLGPGVFSPGELTITPRNGEVSPPAEITPDNVAPQAPAPAPDANAAPINLPSIPAFGAPVAAPAPAPASPGSSDVLTPEQILERLKNKN